MSRATEYALIAVKDMTVAGDVLTSARHLSERHGLPQGLIAKILQRLVNAGIVGSEKGAHGGYRMIKDPDKLSFLELTEAVDGPIRFAACGDAGEEHCVRAHECTVSGPVHALGSEVLGLLSRTTVGGLLRESGANHQDQEVRYSR